MFSTLYDSEVAWFHCYITSLAFTQCSISWYLYNNTMCIWTTSMVKASTTKKSAKEMKSKRKDDMGMCVRERWWSHSKCAWWEENFSSGKCKFLFPVHSDSSLCNKQPWKWDAEIICFHILKDTKTEKTGNGQASSQFEIRYTESYSSWKSNSVNWTKALWPHMDEYDANEWLTEAITNMARIQFSNLACLRSPTTGLELQTNLLLAMYKKKKRSTHHVWSL